MKKITILLSLFLCMQSYIQADTNCFAKSWRLNPQPQQHIKCNCNCKQYKQTSDYHCLRCKHKKIPVTFIIEKSATTQQKSR